MTEVSEEDRCYNAGPVSDEGFATELHNPYTRPVHGRTHIDVYDVCDIFEVDDPTGASQQAVKKILCAGGRGYKHRIQDLQEAVGAINRRIVILEARERRIAILEAREYQMRRAKQGE